jgi:hypothetical protein
MHYMDLDLMPPPNHLPMLHWPHLTIRCFAEM